MYFINALSKIRTDQRCASVMFYISEGYKLMFIYWNKNNYRIEKQKIYKALLSRFICK